jgi:glycine/D-amino acid oxidase-like deaminating enzyme
MSEAQLGSADVAIIGAGLVGSSTAYYLAKGGVDVAVIERGNLNREASGANAGSLHLQIYIHPHFPDDWIDRIRPTIELIREAQKSWATMEERLGTDCGIRLGGGLWVAETPDEMRLIEKKVAAENALGVMSEVHDREGILRLAPYLGEHVTGGSFLIGEGFANPLLVTPAHVNAARKHGARFFADAAVSAIARDGSRFVIETSRGRFSAGQVIAAAGAWTASIGRMVGLNLPVSGSIGQVSVTEGRPNIMLDHMLQHVGKGLTLKQSRQGTFIIGGGWPGLYDRTRDRKSPSFDSIVGNAWIAARTVPEIAKAQLVRAWGGMGSGSADGLPIVGESSIVRGFHVTYVPLGFSMGPIVGQIFSEKFLTGEASLPLAPYTPDRFLDRAA